MRTAALRSVALLWACTACAGSAQDPPAGVKKLADALATEQTAYAKAGAKAKKELLAGMAKLADGAARADRTELGKALKASLLAAVFGRLADVIDPAGRARRAVNLLFLLGVTSFWLGCNTAAKELVKERVIYARERAVNLRADSYLASKILVLTLIALAQVTLLFAVTRAWCGPPGDPFAQWASLALLAAAGTSLGLLVSALSRTEEVALALVPVVVIPQIVLAGVIAPLSGPVELLARGVVGCHQGQLALQRLLPAADRLALGLADGGLTTPLLALAGHAVVCAGVTYTLLTRRGT